LRPGDSQRVARAWEVWRGTGRGIALWQAEQAAPARDWSWRAVILDPPRDALREAIQLRFAAMLRQGAMEEVRALLSLDLDPALPAMRAHGVPELSAVLRGKLTLEAAAAAACLATGQYTKRQATWFRRRHIAAETHTHRLNARIDDPEKLSVYMSAFFNIL
jgi:tRNA dimethylallyltransferase